MTVVCLAILLRVVTVVAVFGLFWDTESRLVLNTRRTTPPTRTTSRARVTSQCRARPTWAVLTTPHVG
jgi:hypothetical protein